MLSLQPSNVLERTSIQWNVACLPVFLGVLALVNRLAYWKSELDPTK
jgi:hypothetical protein